MRRRRSCCRKTWQNARRPCAAAREELKQLGMEFKLQSKELVERYDNQIKAAMRMKEANRAARDILLGDL